MSEQAVQTSLVDRAPAQQVPADRAPAEGLTRQVAGLPYADQVRALQPPAPLQHRVAAPAGAVQAEADAAAPPAASGGGGPPEQVSLSFAGRTITVDMPADAGRTVTVDLAEELGVARLTRAKLRFSKGWDILSGSVSGESSLSVAGQAARASFSMGVSKTGAISAQAKGTISAESFSGSCRLNLEEGGAGGYANIAVTGPMTLAIPGGSATLEAGSKARIDFAGGTFESATISKLVATIGDGEGALVKITGKGSYGADGFSAQGKAALARALSRSLGPFTLSLRQGTTRGAIAMSGASIDSLQAVFAVEVSHAQRGLLGTGVFKGLYKGADSSLKGSGTFVLAPDITFGSPGGFRLVAAKSGNSIGVAVDESGQVKLTLNVDTELHTASDWFAKGQAKNVTWDGNDLVGDFDLRVNTNFSLRIGPLTAHVTSNGRMGVAYVGGELSADGGDLDVSFEWNGKGFGLSWPKWSLSLGALGPLPALRLPDFDLSGLFDWLSLSMPSIDLSWLFDLFRKLALKFPSFGGGGFPKINWPRFSWPDISFPLGGLPDLDISSFFSSLWGSLRDFLGGFDLRFSLPDLMSLLSGLSLPDFDLDWLKNLFSGLGDFSLRYTGDVQLEGRGIALPLVTATDLSATLLNKGVEVATARAPNMSYDGHTFKAWVDLTFAKGLGPSFGEYQVTLDQIGVALELTAGQPAKIVLPQVTGSLRKSGNKLGSAGIANVVFDEAGGVDFDDSAITLTLEKALPVGPQTGEFAFALRPGASLGVSLAAGELAGFEGQGVGLDVKRGGKPFAAAVVESFAYDVPAERLEQASASLSLAQPLAPIPGVTLGQGTVGAEIADNAIARLDVAGLAVGFARSVAGKPVKLEGSVVEGSYDVAKGELTKLDASLTLAAPISFGPAAARVTLAGGATVGLVVSNGAVEKVSLDQVQAELEAAGGSFGLGLRDAQWTDAGISGTATASLSPQSPIRFGPAGAQVALDGGSASLTLADGLPTSLSLAGLSGGLERGEERLATVTVTKGTYDFTRGEITEASASFAMGEGKVLAFGPLHASKVNGSLELGGGDVAVSGGGELGATFGEGRHFAGKAQVQWKRAGGVDDFAGTTASIEGVLIKDDAKKRFLGGSLEVAIGPGNTPQKFEGDLTFSLMDGIGGTLHTTVEQSGEKLDPLVRKGTSFGFSKKLLRGRPLVDFDLQKLVPGLKPKAYGPAKFGLGGGFGLNVGDLSAGSEVTFTDDYRPAEGGLPKFEAPIDLDWSMAFDAELFGVLGLRIPFYGIIHLGGGMEGGISTALKLDIKPTLTAKSDGESVDFAFDINLELAPQAELNLGLTVDLAIGLPQIGLALEFSELIAELPVALGNLFDIVVSGGLDFGDGGTRQRASSAPVEKHDVSVPEHDFGPAPAGRARSNQLGGGDSGGVLPGLDGLTKAGDGGGQFGGLSSLLEKVKLIEGAAKGLSAIALLASKIVSGLSAFLIGGPLGFVVWALWELITGGIGDIIKAVQDVGKSMGAVRELLAGVLDSPDMKWLADALLFLDSEADDKAREQVAKGEHRRAPMKVQANLIKAMYAGATGDEDENAILTVLRDSPDLASLLIAISGELKAGVDEALGEFQGSEDDALVALFKARGLGWLIDIADDVYAREVAGDPAILAKMTTVQRGKLLAMLESGDCGDADEQAINKVLAFSLANGDVGGVLAAGFGSVASAREDLNSSIDGDENDAFWRIMGGWFATTGFGRRPSERWPERVAALPDYLRDAAVAALDGDKNLHKPELTWDRAIESLGSKKPFTRPLDGVLADAGWAAVSKAAGSELDEVQRKDLRSAIYGGALAELKRPLAAALLQGEGLSDGGQVRRYLARPKAKGKA